MKVTHITGKHLPLSPDGKPIEKCAMCGSCGIDGFATGDVIGSNFLDCDYLGDGDGICIYCAACLGKEQPRNEVIRVSNFIATESELLRFKRDEIWQHIFNPPQDEPFVFAVTYSYKKHIVFKASVNLPGERPYCIQTDNSRVIVDLDAITELAQTIQQWYSIAKQTATEPTFFTKNEILSGSHNYKRITEYGIDDYMAEDSIISPYRGTALLGLLAYALNKGQYIERIVQQPPPRIEPTKQPQAQISFELC